MSKEKKILITGAAGFIGYHLCEKLLDMDYSIVGLDNINDYYNVNLKYDRLENLGIKKNKACKFNLISVSEIYGTKMQFIRINLQDSEAVNKLFIDHEFDLVCNLAAQAGVRYSIENPKAYIDSNINGFINILECCKNYKINRLVYASSSSVYGKSDKIPFVETQNVDNPISLYAATKKSNELMAYTYSHLYGIETIGLRFFTVYGPWGRPDMALFLFTKAILNSEPIDIFNFGNHSRDFTYIDDVIMGVINTLVVDSKNKNLYKLYNIGNSNPVELLDFVSLIEKNLNMKSIKNMLPIQPGDVAVTYSNTDKLNKDYNYRPSVTVLDGVKLFIDWYKNYFNI